MDREIIFTRNEYKEKYKGLMQSYLLGYEDLDEIDFIKSEILLYKNYIIKISSLRIKANFSGRIDWQGLENNLDEIETQIRKKLYSVNNEFNEQIFININTSFDKIIQFLEHKKVNPTHILEAEALEDVYLGQPTNDKANKLFDYLIDNYRSNEITSVKYVNILHYLKNDVSKDLYIFNLKQGDYKDMIKKKCNIEIKKFAKSERYEDVEKPVLNSLLSSFSRHKD
jgi:hypothetical protein